MADYSVLIMARSATGTEQGSWSKYEPVDVFPGERAITQHQHPAFYLIRVTNCPFDIDTVRIFLMEEHRNYRKARLLNELALTAQELADLETNRELTFSYSDLTNIKLRQRTLNEQR